MTVTIYHDPDCVTSRNVLADQELVAGPDGLQLHLPKARGAVAHRRTGDAAEQRRHLPPHPVASEGLQELAAGEHQRDDRVGQGLAERRGAAHGQCPEQVEAELAAAEAAPDVVQEGEQHRRRRRREDPMCRVGRAAEEREGAGGEPAGRDGGQRARRDVLLRSAPSHQHPSRGLEPRPLIHSNARPAIRR